MVNHNTSNKTEVITVRISPSLRYDVERKAKREGMSFSEAVRYVLRRWVDGE